MARGKEKANAYGKDGEKNAGALIRAFMPTVHWKELDGQPRPIASPQYPFTHPWNKSGRGFADFMLFGNLRTIKVQIKHQNRGGSVDEKIIASYEAALHALKYEHFDMLWIVLYGIHWANEPGLMKYLKEVKTEQYARLSIEQGTPSTAHLIIDPDEFRERLEAFIEYES